MLIPKVPLVIFLALSGISGVPSLLGIFNFVLRLKPEVETGKNRIVNNIRVDPKTGAYISQDEKFIKLVNFKSDLWFGILVTACVLSFIAASVYLISSFIPFLDSSLWYEQFISIMTWVGVTPPFVAVFALIILYRYVLRLKSTVKK